MVKKLKDRVEKMVFGIDGIEQDKLRDFRTVTDDMITHRISYLI